MAITLESLYNQLKDIRVYLIKIGPSRRTGPILETKSSEANKIYETYQSSLEKIDQEIKAGNIKADCVPVIENVCERIVNLYYEILELCNLDVKNISLENNESESNATMSTFDLKTALSLLPNMTNEESVTKQLIDNIEYYDSILTQANCKQSLINFVLKSRLSQAAKLKLKTEYASVTELITDMRSELLPQKAAPAIQSKLQNLKQNELSVSDFGKQLTELFVDLTISQASGNKDCYKILKPLNEKYAIKRFADGLRNRRLSTIISARNYSSLKDAIQAAQEEEVSTTSTSGEIFGMYRRNYFNPNSTRSRSGFRGSRGNNRFSSYRPRGHGGQYRGSNQPSTGFQRPPRRPNRGSKLIIILKNGADGFPFGVLAIIQQFIQKQN
ncbi:uncharacterized protein [Choristoneura fumiferana]|uniref:uncharacterized protein n=1 Tax=Choristoneura fumiferana TaxID=7141 RepID=UPI003D15D9C9